jgi:hypothetical protein
LLAVTFFFCFLAGVAFLPFLVFDFVFLAMAGARNRGFETVRSETSMAGT